MQAKHAFLRGRHLIVAAFAAAWLVIVPLSPAQQPASPPREDAKQTKKDDGESSAPKPPAQPAFPDPVGARRLSPRYPVWVDPKEKAVIVDGKISLQKGMLEMFACTRNTKEHEAIVSADTKAFLVHTGLLSLGAEAGHPARFQPKYDPPTGTEIEVLIRWKDAKGQMQTARAQDWILDIRTKKPMTYPFVFGGSSFWTDPETGTQHYQAEGGDFVCVSNFGSAMLDIPVKSSQSNEELEFEANTAKIPPLGAVRLVFKPKLKDKKGEGGGPKGEGTKPKEEVGKPKAEAAKPTVKETAPKAEGKAK